MFKGEVLQIKMLQRGLTPSKLACILGCSEAALTRKWEGESDFTRNEMQLIRHGLGLSEEEMNEIFFASKLA